MTNAVLMILKVAFVISLFVGGPLITIWAINTLFHTAIPFRFETWLAVVVLWNFSGIVITGRK